MKTREGMISIMESEPSPHNTPPAIESLQQNPMTFSCSARLVQVHSYLPRDLELEIRIHGETLKNVL